MSEPTVTYSSGSMDHLCLVWPLPGTSLPVEMNVCVLSIIVGADECEEKCIPTSRASLRVSCWVPRVTLESKNMSKGDCVATILTDTFQTGIHISYLFVCFKCFFQQAVTQMNRWLLSSHDVVAHSKYYKKLLLFYVHHF